MLNLRPYEPEDAQVILSWIKDEKALRRWSADRYGAYPIVPEDMERQYAGHELSDTMFPMTMVDGETVVGHLLLRFPGEDRTVLRFGFVIVDDSKRGMGYGKKLLSLAAAYAFKTFGVEKITLGVFANNPSAYHCYKAVGFRNVQMETEEYYAVMGECWKCLEMELERKTWN